MFGQWTLDNFYILTSKVVIPYTFWCLCFPCKMIIADFSSWVWLRKWSIYVLKKIATKGHKNEYRWIYRSSTTELLLYCCCIAIDTHSYDPTKHWKWYKNTDCKSFAIVEHSFRVKIMIWINCKRIAADDQSIDALKSKLITLFVIL